MSKQQQPPPTVTLADDQTVIMLSRKILERKLEPELVQIGDRMYVNLGAGLLAELAAETVLSKYPEAEVVRNGLDEVLLWHGPAATTKYEQMRLVISVLM